MWTLGIAMWYLLEHRGHPAQKHQLPSLQLFHSEHLPPQQSSLPLDHLLDPNWVSLVHQKLADEHPLLEQPITLNGIAMYENDT